ncbi:MAG: Hint domain-containing protein [Chitinophagaceae bacterium]
MKKFLLLPLFIIGCFSLAAQDTAQSHKFSIDEYQKAKTFRIKDLDNDTYVKFENTYVLDRYESRKPYFITGDDGLKKRVDIYKLLLREGKQDLGTVIFYTNEKGVLYTACLPNFRADAKVWEKYFEDIHATDKIESNYVLKLSYVLSKEFGFQLYKAANQGKDVSKEAGTYGMDICFPGDEQVAMWDGSKKLLSQMQKGDKIVTVDPLTKLPAATEVTALVSHEIKNYAITQLVLLSANEQLKSSGRMVRLSVRQINATPNHPVLTDAGEMKMGDVKEGDKILCRENNQEAYKKYIVWTKTEQAGGLQKVYNIETKSGSTFIMNGVMVLQKGLKQQ